MKNKIYFGLMLALMLMGGISIFATGQRTFSEKENRYLNTFSDISGTDHVEEALADQFALRDEWLALYAGASYLRGMREINDTLIGSDGYLLNACETQSFDWNGYRKNLLSVQAFATKYDVKTDVVLVPSPATILADKLPYGAIMYDADRAYAMASEIVKGASVVDLREAMTACSQNEQAYYRTDHHWTTMGAWAAYQKLHKFSENETTSETTDLHSVTDTFYGTMYSRVPNPLTPADSIYALKDAPTTGEVVVDAVSGDTLYDPDKLLTKDKYAYFLGGNQARADYEGTGEGSLLLIKDSYANCLVPFLLADYAHITVIDLRFYNGTNDDLMEEQFSRVMVLYEMSNFAEDTGVYKLAR